jgi:hypothetical protein
MFQKRINEGFGDLASNIGGAIKQDIMKGSGPWAGFVDALLKNPIGERKKNKPNVDNIPKKVEGFKPVVPDYAKKQKEHLTLKNVSKTGTIDDVLNYLKDIKAREDLYAYYRWSFYIDVYIKKNHKDAAAQTVLFDIIMDVKEDKVKLDTHHYDELNKLIQDNVVNQVEKNKSSFDAQIKKMPKKENNMSFKQFLEEKEKKIKEGLLSGGPVDPTAANPGKAREVKVKSTKASIDTAKADKSKAELAKAQAALSADSASKAKQLEEGVYAGADGKPKKIPFTQDPNLKDQAVGPKPEKNEDDEYQTAMDKRKKDLEEITKKLQKLADEACEVAKDNIDPTEDNLIDKMAAKERSDLKEGEASWAEMEKNLEALNEACIGGVCTMGGRSNDAGGAIGNMGISPMGSIGLSMPTSHISQPSPNQVADRSTIYTFIKNNDLHRVSRDYALNTLLSQFGNASTELSTILSDAILSDGSPADIDSSYGYSDSSLKAIQDPVEDIIPDGGIDHSNDGLDGAWATMEDRLKDL